MLEQNIIKKNIKRTRFAGDRRFGGVVVSVLATGPKGCGLKKPAKAMGF
jgi:hypothetical protein